MLSARSVVIMLCGSVIEVMDLSTAAACSLLIIVAIDELGGAYPSLVFICSSVLGLMLLPVKLPALYYALFFGWYPMIKLPLDRMNRAIRLILKLLVITVSVTLMMLTSRLFLPTDELLGLNIWAGALCIVVFFIYDIALSRITLTYLSRIRHKLGFLGRQTRK